MANNEQMYTEEDVERILKERELESLRKLGTTGVEADPNKGKRGPVPNRMNWGVGLKKDPVKTAKIDARRRSMNVNQPSSTRARGMNPDDWKIEAMGRNIQKHGTDQAFNNLLAAKDPGRAMEYFQQANTMVDMGHQFKPAPAPARLYQRQVGMGQAEAEQALLAAKPNPIARRYTPEDVREISEVVKAGRVSLDPAGEKKAREYEALAKVDREQGAQVLDHIQSVRKATGVDDFLSMFMGQMPQKTQMGPPAPSEKKRTPPPQDPRDHWDWVENHPEMPQYSGKKRGEAARGYRRWVRNVWLPALDDLGLDQWTRKWMADMKLMEVYTLRSGQNFTPRFEFHPWLAGSTGMIQGEMPPSVRRPDRMDAYADPAHSQEAAWMQSRFK